MDGAAVTLSDSELDDPELLDELAAITGQGPSREDSLRASANSKKALALSLKRKGDLKAAAAAFKEYKALQAELGAGGGTGRARESDPSDVSTVIATDADLEDPELLAELAAVTGIPQKVNRAAEREMGVDEPSKGDPQPSRRAGEPVRQAGELSNVAGDVAVSVLRPGPASAEVEAMAPQESALLLELQKKLAEARADAARAKANGQKLEAMRALRLANRLQEQLKAMGWSAGAGVAGLAQPSTDVTRASCAASSPFAAAQRDEQSLADVSDAQASGSIHRARAPSEGKHEDEDMAQLLASVNSLPTDAAGAKRSGRAQGMPFVTTPDASSERPAGAPASLDELELQRLLESMSHSGSGRGGEEGGDAEPPLSPELRQLLQRMSKPCRGSAQEEELHPELAKLLQKMSAPGTSRAKEENELPPELARLLEQMNGPSRVQAAAPDEESNPELDLLIERMSCASTATARGPSASMAGSSLAGSRAGSAVGSRGPSLATSPQPSRDAESDRFDAERSYLESQEGQMLLAAGVPRDEILASLPSHSGTAPAEGAGGGQPTAPEKAVLPVVNRPPTASTPVASPGVTAPGGASHAAGGALALKVEALRLKQAGDVPGAIAKMREAKALEAAALATQVGEGSSPLAGGGAKSSPSLPDSACRVAAQGKSSPHSSSNGQPTTSSPHTVQTGSAPPALDDRNVSKAGTKMAIGSRTASPASTEQESARSSAASPSPASSASESVAAHVATLKREAVQLKRAGDIVGATAKLRQARAVEAGAAKPAANVAAEAAHVT